MSSLSTPPLCSPEIENTSSSSAATLVDVIMDEMQQDFQRNEKPCIFKIPNSFRSVSSYTDAYTPCRVAIGPYHAKNADLEPMQLCKLNFLCQVSSDLRYKDFVPTLLTLENLELAKNYYERKEDINHKTLGRIILTDGAFVVWFLASIYSLPTRTNLQITLTGREKGEILRDLLLLENQLPFFILERWFQFLYRDGGHVRQNFSTLAYYALMCSVPIQKRNFTSEAMKFYSETDNMEEFKTSDDIKHLLHLITISCIPRHEYECDNTSEDLPVFSEPFKSATELHQAGVHFRKISASVFNAPLVKFNHNEKRLVMKFANGVLEMPHLTLEEFSESFFRNIIAFEQYYLNTFEMTAYMCFMDHLIDTSDDVQILQESQVIESWLESKENVVKIFNTITKHTIIDLDCNLGKVSKDMNSYVRRPLNKWKATLRRDYFGTPWAPISFIIAIVLLILTILQTLTGLQQIQWKFQYPN